HTDRPRGLQHHHCPFRDTRHGGDQLILVALQQKVREVPTLRRPILSEDHRKVRTLDLIDDILRSTIKKLDLDIRKRPAKLLQRSRRMISPRKLHLRNRNAPVLCPPGWCDSGTATPGEYPDVCVAAHHDNAFRRRRDGQSLLLVLQQDNGL